MDPVSGSQVCDFTYSLEDNRMKQGTSPPKCMPIGANLLTHILLPETRPVIASKNGALQNLDAPQGICLRALYCHNNVSILNVRLAIYSHSPSTVVLPSRAPMRPMSHRSNTLVHHVVHNGIKGTKGRYRAAVRSTAVLKS